MNTNEKGDAFGHRFFSNTFLQQRCQNHAQCSISFSAMLIIGCG